jgi:hypothetical protein
MASHIGAVLVLKICALASNPTKSDDGRRDSPRKDQALDGAFRLTYLLSLSATRFRVGVLWITGLS